VKWVFLSVGPLWAHSGVGRTARFAVSY
jgi:hypothetical protein